MVVRVTPNSAAIAATVCARFAVGSHLVVHRPGQGGLAGSEIGSLPAGAAAGGGQAVGGALRHQGVLGDGSQDLEEHPPDGGGGVDALVEDHQVHPARGGLVGQVDQVLQGAAQPVQFCDDELVAQPSGIASGRRASLLDAVSRNTFSHPAVCRASCGDSGCWSRVETRP